MSARNFHFTPMNEYQRMQYLEAMDIACYVPRWELPAAKTSSVCELPVQKVPPGGLQDVHRGQGHSRHEAPVSSDQVVPAAGKDIANVLSRLDAIVSGGPEAKDEVKGSPLDAQNDSARHAVVDAPSGTPGQDLPSQIDAISERLAVNAEAAAFSLALWRVGQDLQVIDSRRPGDALPTHALLANMLSAVDLLALNLPSAEHLTWPMVDTHSDKSWAAASEMVNGFFEGRFAAQSVSVIIVLGEDAHRALLGESNHSVDHYLEALYSFRELEVFAAQVLVLPSLTDILYSPSLKSAVWSSLLLLPQYLDK